MRLAAILPGDIVLVDKRGRRFHALVTTTGADLGIRPTDSRVTYRTATAVEVITHWSLRGRPRAGHKRRG
jgi:hypothetical protein